jgi:Transposase and inactivated derivatives
MSMQPRPWPRVPEQTAVVARAAFPKGSLAMRVRDELGEVFADERFAAGFGVRGAPAESPGLLALVTALQYVEDLTDRQAAEAVRARIDWKYALGMELTDPGFDHSVLCKFRARLVEHALEERALDLLLAALKDKGLVAAGGKQRTDSTHVISAVRDLNRLELAGESVRACLEALSAAAPVWLADAIDLAGWSRRYSSRIDTWRSPASEIKRAELATAYGTDGIALLRAVYDPGSPVWLRELPAAQTLRIVVLQNYIITTGGHGREVVKRRESDTDGLPPGRSRVSSPYDLDARWGVKRDTFWNGYKVHISETCTAPADPGTGTRPNLITHVATTDATVPDSKMTQPIHNALKARDLLPAEHYLDSGYPSADLVLSSARDFGITLITPLLADTSPQARAKNGFDRTAFTIDFDNQRATCPQGAVSASWSPAAQRGTETIVVTFTAGDCGPCPVRQQCTTSKRGRRQLTIRPRQVHEALNTARAEQDGKPWQAKYALRAGVEGTIRQAVAVTTIRHARYRGLPKTHLEHVYSAVALNLIRMDAWWTGHPLDRTRTSHLARLDHALAA